jgi:hypothetical protein
MNSLRLLCKRLTIGGVTRDHDSPACWANSKFFLLTLHVKAHLFSLIIGFARLLVGH